jgi:hypothetical protein
MKKIQSERPRLSRAFAAPVLGALAAGLLALAAMVPGTANAAGDLARFDGGIGSQPLRAGGLTNDVNNTQPGGRPWVISDLKATVSADGHIRVDGRGLLLAGGGTIGTPAGQSVHARLFCGGAASDTATLVPLEANGDFRINDVLLPTPPSPCLTPVLLIINGANAWFAAGIPK